MYNKMKALTGLFFVFHIFIATNIFADPPNQPDTAGSRVEPIPINVNDNREEILNDIQHGTSPPDTTNSETGDTTKVETGNNTPDIQSSGATTHTPSGSESNNSSHTLPSPPTHYFNYAVTPWGTAVEVGNSIIYFDRLSHTHSFEIIKQFILNGSIYRFIRLMNLSVLPFQLVSGTFSFFYLLDLFSQAFHDNSWQQRLYTIYLFSFLYRSSHINPTMTQITFRAGLAFAGYINGYIEQTLGTQSAQYTPVHFTGDAARLFSARLIFTGSSATPVKYELYRLPLHIPAGDDSYQRLALAIDQLELDHITIFSKPTNMLYDGPNSPIGQTGQRISVTFTLPGKDTPLELHLNLPANESSLPVSLIMEGILKKDDRKKHNSVQSVFSPETIGLIANALDYFKLNRLLIEDEKIVFNPWWINLHWQTSLINTRHDSEKSHFTFTTPNSGSVTLEWHDGSLLWPWSGVVVDTQKYGFRTSHEQYIVPEWMGTILFTLASLASRRAGSALTSTIVGWFQPRTATAGTSSGLFGFLSQPQRTPFDLGDNVTPEELEELLDDAGCPICLDNNIADENGNPDPLRWLTCCGTVNGENTGAFMHENCFQHLIANPPGYAPECPACRAPYVN